jgi:hypothetical protein
MKVWFRCNGKNTKLFRLNYQADLDYIPLVGDTIHVSKDHFSHASYRMKEHRLGKDIRLRESVYMDFKVVSRSFSLVFNEWELICEPTPQDLMNLLGKIKTK